MLGIEVLSLLMIVSPKAFVSYFDMFIKGIEQERPEPRKSQQVGLMLRGLFDSVIVHALFLKKTNLVEGK